MQPLPPSSLEKRHTTPAESPSTINRRPSEPLGRTPELKPEEDLTMNMLEYMNEREP